MNEFLIKIKAALDSDSFQKFKDNIKKLILENVKQSVEDLKDLNNADNKEADKQNSDNHGGECGKIAEYARPVQPHHNDADHAKKRKGNGGRTVIRAFLRF